ncbi:Outer membrane protein and related peptidoglycan-associated (lipo)proteins [Alteromonadaceae bacterium Bs31]|nr:Outer membrane protein and related peptidoglycan-associated (lipo)proteins [Alteromonadaceae bacterium Bs31]
MRVRVLGVSIWLGLLLSSQGLLADELMETLFASAKSSLREANTELAMVLAPVSYEKGAKAYSSAKARYKKSHKVSRIESDLATAEKYFVLAVKNARLAQLTFGGPIQARTDAKSVDAKELAVDEWQKAEDKFLSATRTLETGNINSARQKAADAEKLYRDAELVAIKGQYLNQARAKIVEAQKLKVKRYAPKTLERAISLLAAAEKELSENRYDTDYPRALVKDAYYEARHSIYLAKEIQSLKKDKSPEDLILELEAPLAGLAGEVDVVAEFDKGFDSVGESVTIAVRQLVQSSLELEELKNKNNGLLQEYAALETRLGIQSERLQIEEQSRERLKKVNSYFSQSEAMVLTQGKQGLNVLVRMVGLNFEPGSSRLSEANKRLLRKLEQAIRLYPEYTVVVEGHTDSFGSTGANQSLSLDRANAVRHYLVVNMKELSIGRCEAHGYGETRPIANNETREGRKRNRRIDLLLKAPSS